MNPSTPKTELQPPTQLRKAVFGGTQKESAMPMNLKAGTRVRCEPPGWAGWGGAARSPRPTAQPGSSARFVVRVLLVATLLSICWTRAAEDASNRTRPKLIKLPENLGPQTMECTPIEYQGRQLLFQSWRGTIQKPGDTYLALQDLATGQRLSRFGDGFSLGCALVTGNQINAYATQNDIYRFTSADGTNWAKTLALARSGGEHLFNSSVCQDNQGYLMAYETDQPLSFGFKFARSKDLTKWEKIDGLIFAGVGGKQYSACPVIRYFEPYYYVIYLHTAIPGHTGFVSFLARSQDLATWELTPFNPILEAGPGEGINNSDVDLIERDGTTYVYYATGDQQTWLDLKRAVYPGPMKEFFVNHFPEGSPGIKVSAVRK